MSKYRTFGPNDDQIQPEGDRGFLGVNMREDPSQLEPGLAAGAINKDFSLGKADPRYGYRTMPWAQNYGVDFPIDFDFDFYDSGFQKVRGGSVFSDPYGVEGALVATKYGVYKLVANKEPLPIPLPLNERLNDRVRMIQCFDRVVMFRGEDEVPLVWNPTLDMELNVGEFDYITQTSGRGTDPDNTFGDGLQTIPNAADATLFANRLFIPVGRDEVVVSDILDYTRYSVVEQRFRINEGSDDRITKIVPWNRTTLIVFKNQSIFMLENAYADLSGIRSAIITNERGLIGTDAWAPVGQDVWYWSEGGIFSVVQTDHAELQAGSAPLSSGIQNLVDRINWNAASGIVMHASSHYIYSAIPIDGSLYNNVIVSYNRLTGQWQGYHTADFIAPFVFLQQDYAGRRNLFFLNDNNPETEVAQGAYFLTGHGLSDDLYGTESEIEDELLTRGYRIGIPDFKRAHQITVQQSTLRPKFTITGKTDGVNEEWDVDTDQTKDRTKYYAHGLPAYNPENPLDNHARRGREDYSVELGAGEEIDPGENGFNPQLMQEVKQVYRFRRRGSYVQVRIQNTQGRHSTHAVTVEAVQGRRSQGAQA